LTVFPSPDFSLCLSLLPPHALLQKTNSRQSKQQRNDAAFCEQVQKLNALNNHLASGDYTAFWSAYDGDDDMADLVADISGFEDLMRLRIVVAVSQAWREIQRDVLEEWLNLEDSDFDHLMDVVGFKSDGDLVKVPLNKENEAKGTVIRENVKFDRKSATAIWKALQLTNMVEFSRVIRRAFEQPA
jgi:translation initiation factor 3 subunit K